MEDGERTTVARSRGERGYDIFVGRCQRDLLLIG